MLINEILNVARSPAARASIAQGAVNRLAQRAGTAGIPQATPAPGFGIGAQQQAAAGSAAMVAQMAKQLAAMWTKELQAAMKPLNVAPITGIPNPQLISAIERMVNRLVARISGNLMSKYDDTPSGIQDQNIVSQMRQSAADIKQTIDHIVITAPSADTVAKGWQTIAQSAYNIANQALFSATDQQVQSAQVQFAVDANNNLTLNGRVVQDDNGQPIQGGTPEAAKYMKQFGVTAPAPAPAPARPRSALRGRAARPPGGRAAAARPRTP